MNLLEIFKPGRHTAMSGETLEFTPQHLAASAAAYDPKLYEAPIVVGHPELDAPAYGWIKSLSYDDTLQAEPDQVEPTFAEMVNAGRFKKISASFFKPDAPNNPKPGVYYLRHVGFLGAAAPAVRGLKNASFADDDALVLEFADWSDKRNASLWRSLRDFLIEKFGREEADRAIPDYAVTDLTEAAAQPTDNPKPAFSESKEEPPKMKALLALLGLSDTATEEQAIAAFKARDAQFAEREQTLNAREASFAERETRLATGERAMKRKAHESFLDDLIKQGRLLPAQKAQQLEFMCALSEEATIEFSEGDQVKKKSPLDAHKENLAAAPVAVDFVERSGTDKNPPAEIDMKDANAIATAALAFQASEKKAGRDIAIDIAVKHVTTKKS